MLTKFDAPGLPLTYAMMAAYFSLVSVSFFGLLYLLPPNSRIFYDIYDVLHINLYTDPEKIINTTIKASVLAGLVSLYTLASLRARRHQLLQWCHQMTEVTTKGAEKKKFGLDVKI